MSEGGAVVLAHAYGIPEAITVVVPMVVLVAIVVAGRRRKESDVADAADGPDAQPTNGDDVST